MWYFSQNDGVGTQSYLRPTVSKLVGIGGIQITEKLGYTYTLAIPAKSLVFGCLCQQVREIDVLSFSHSVGMDN